MRLEKHYEFKDSIEPWQLINKFNFSFNIGNYIKYQSRLGKKDDVSKEISKMNTYIDFEIARLENDWLVNKKTYSFHTYIYTVETEQLLIDTLLQYGLGDEKIQYFLALCAAKDITDNDDFETCRFYLLKLKYL